MKTIIENATKLSKYLLDDATPVTFLADRINVGDPNNLDFIIGDLNEGNASLVENVPTATDGTEVTVEFTGNFREAGVEGEWIGNKFIYDGGWVANPDWVEPEKEDDALFEAAGQI